MRACVLDVMGLPEFVKRKVKAERVRGVGGKAVTRVCCLPPPVGRWRTVHVGVSARPSSATAPPPHSSSLLHQTTTPDNPRADAHVDGAAHTAAFHGDVEALGGLLRTYGRASAAFAPHGPAGWTPLVRDVDGL